MREKTMGKERCGFAERNKIYKTNFATSSSEDVNVPTYCSWVANFFRYSNLAEVCFYEFGG